MNTLITGAAGFMGPFLAKQCKDAGETVLGIDFLDPPAGWFTDNFERIDVRDAEKVSALIAKYRPGRVFHLAAQSYPTVSMQKPFETIASNAGGTVNVFEALRAENLRSMVVVACSSAEYGMVTAEDLPVKETHALNPLHPYGVSKVAQDLLAQQYFLNYGMPTVRVRIFNTTGPGKMGDVCSDFSRRAVEIELGLRTGPMTTGSLTTRRAIIDVRDMVRGLWMAAEAGEPGEVYNVGGSAIYSGHDLIDFIRASIRVPLELAQDPALMRPQDEPVIAGDTTKFREKTGWKQEIHLKQTVADMIQWFRDRKSAEAAASQPALAGN